jgi:hypothetical protein
VLFRAAPAIIGAASGETLTTASAMWLWIAAVLPSAFAGGLAFPILADVLGEGGGGRAYALEAAGALVGGVLVSAAVVGLGAAAAICLALGIVTAVALWPWSRWLAVLAAVAGIALAAPAAGVLERDGWSWSDHPGALIDWQETRLQRLELSGGPPLAVYADGSLLASYPDPYVVLPRAHLTMLLHEDPRQVFAIGCVTDGSVEAMVRHPVDRLVVVEEDPLLLRRIPGWYGPKMAAAVAGPTTRAIASDPVRALSSGGPWDLVILRDGDPTNLRRNRTRTLEFFRRCRANMSDDGILVLRIGVNDTYLGGAGGRLVSVLAATLRAVFPVIEVIPGEEILLVAGGERAVIDLDDETLGSRLETRGIERTEMIPEMIPLLIDRDRAVALENSLDTSAPVTTIDHPRAVLLAAGLHEARAMPSLLRLALALERRSAWPLAAVLGIGVLALLAMTLIRKQSAATTAATVGFASIGWWLLLIATWQATRGSVYSEVGALTATFMAGLAGGAGFACRWSRPARHLPFVLVAGSVLSLLIAGGIAIRLPLVAVPMLLIVGGCLTGAAFPGLTALSHRNSRLSAGVAFAADEAGAAAGALVVGIIAIPWAGLTATALGLAVLSLATIPAVLMTLRRDRLRHISVGTPSEEIQR